MSSGIQLGSLKARKSSGQLRRRADRIRRRLNAGRLHVASGPKQRVRWIDRLRAIGHRLMRKQRQENRNKAFALAGVVESNKAAIVKRSMFADRCDYQHVTVNGRGQKVLGAPCGGKLQKNKKNVLTCRTCGRVSDLTDAA